MITRDEIAAVILAGGLGRRMGGIEKGLLPFQGRPLVSHVIDCVRPHVGPVIVSANRRLDEYASLDVAVVADEWADARGPLVGIASALRVTSLPYLLVAPCDTPFLPKEWVPQLATALSLGEADAALAHGDGALQPLCALMCSTLAPKLRDFIDAGGAVVKQWWAEQRTVSVVFDERGAFANINSLEDRARLE